MNSTIAGIDQATSILLVGTFPRWEAAMVNARIRRAWLERKVPISVIGEMRDYNYPVTHLGEGVKAVQDLMRQKPALGDKPMVIVGAGVFARRDGAAIQEILGDLVQKLGIVTNDWNGYNVLQTAASRVGALDLGFVPQRGGLATRGILEAAQKGKIEIIYALGVDEIDPEQFGKAFVIYQGHHGDVLAGRADIILPGSAYTEKNAIFVNTEGRPQQARQALFPPGEAKEDWKIMRAISELVGKGKTLPYNNLGELRRRMIDINAIFGKIDTIVPTPWKALGKPYPTDNTPMTSPIMNFYQTCAISRASETMAKCTDAFIGENIPMAAE
jgi:NADH-quinone oxidoreductase subunit G